MKPLLLAIVLVTALAGSAGCDRSNPTPMPSPTSPTPATPVPAPSPAATVVSIRITGNALLTAVGATSALTATATMSDGSSKDVTTAVQWTSSDPSTITVAASGIVTVVRFGASYVRANSGTRSASVNIQATPAGTVVVFGRVREPGSSGLPGVLVREDTSGASILSDSDGGYSLGALPSGRLAFEKDGYERVAGEAKPATFFDVAMQRVIRIGAGGKVDVKLAPHDMDYEAAPGSRCYPCRMIRVTTAGTAQLHLSVAWTEPHARLSMWINGQLFEGAALGPSEAVADVTVNSGELVVYVGMKTPVEYYAPFTLTTAVVK